MVENIKIHLLYKNVEKIILLGEKHDYPPFREQMVKVIAEKEGGYDNIQLFYEAAVPIEINGHHTISLEPALRIENLKDQNNHTTYIKQNVPVMVSDLVYFIYHLVDYIQDGIYDTKAMNARFIDVVWAIPPGKNRELCIDLFEAFEKDKGEETARPLLVYLETLVETRCEQLDEPIDFGEKIMEKGPNGLILEMEALRDAIMLETFVKEYDVEKTAIIIVGDAHVDNLRALLLEEGLSSIKEFRMREKDIGQGKKTRKGKKVKSVKKRRSSRRRTKK
jgi:hypothetical protein